MLVESFINIIFHYPRCLDMPNSSHSPVTWMHVVNPIAETKRLSGSNKWSIPKTPKAIALNHKTLLTTVYRVAKVIADNLLCYGKLSGGKMGSGRRESEGSYDYGKHWWWCWYNMETSLNVGHWLVRYSEDKTMLVIWNGSKRGTSPLLVKNSSFNFNLNEEFFLEGRKREEEEEERQEGKWALLCHKIGVRRSKQEYFWYSRPWGEWS